MNWFSGLFFVIAAVAASSIQQQLQSGLCLCIEDNDVYARADPGGANPIVGVLKIDHCLVSHGGLMHIKGVTWYEFSMVDGTKIWVDGIHLRAVEMTICTNPTTTQPTTTTTPVTAITTAAAITTNAPQTTTTPFDPFAGLDFCFTDQGLIAEGQQSTQNGAICTCHSGNLVCP